MADPVNVGYYDMVSGEGAATQVDEIVEVGLTPVNVTVLTPEVLATLRVLVVQNGDNESFGAEFLAAKAAIDAAVANGLVVIIHDRFVTGGNTLLSALNGVTFVRDLSGAGAQMQLAAGGAAIASTPYGTVTDTSLDNFGYSNHGYVTRASLPDGAIVFMTRDNTDQVTVFGVPSGAGMVIYTSVPIDFWGDAVVGSSGSVFDFDTTGMEAFARNLLAYAAGVMAPAGSATDDTATVTESVATTIAVLENDTSPNTALRITTVGGQAITVGATVTLATGSTVRLNADGTLTYTTGASYDALRVGQTGAETFAYTVSNVSGSFTDEGSVSVTINGDYERIGPATPRADNLVGTVHDDYVDGLAGNDVISTGLGNDVIRGGQGGDKMTGGGGDDYYYVDNTGDHVIEALNGGNDTVESSLAAHTLAANVETLILGEGGRDGTGNALNNQITGNGGANTLNGGAGNDMIDGGGGADIIIGGAGSDTLFGGAGADTFQYQSPADIGAGAPLIGRGSIPATVSIDTILDFSVREGDRIDLRALDANINTRAVNDDFVVVSQFTRVAGQLVIEAVADRGGAIAGEAAPGGNFYRLLGDTNGDGVSDFTLNIYSQSVLQVSDLSSILGIQSVSITQIPGQPVERDAAPAGLDAGWFI